MKTGHNKHQGFGCLPIWDKFHAYASTEWLEIWNYMYLKLLMNKKLPKQVPHWFFLLQ